MSESRSPARSFGSTALRCAFTLVAIWLLSTERVGRLFGSNVRAVMTRLESPQLSRRDQDQLTRGYYENLTSVNRFNSRLWEAYAGAESVEDRRPIRDTDLVTITNDFQFLELKPDLRSLYRGRPFHTNQWGMRDREYGRTPEPGVRRIAMLGQSYVMGGGVANEETFEALLETQLNQDAGADAFEILNFGSGNYMPARQLVQLQRTVLSFQPHVIVSVGHQADLRRLPSNFADALFAKATIPLPFVQAVIDSIGINTETSHEEAMRLLVPYRERLYQEIQRAFVEVVKSAGALPVWVMIPTPDHGPRDDDIDFMVAASRAAGFVTIDLFDVYGEAAPSLWVADWDSHPDARGHTLIAARLLSAFRDTPGILRPD